MQSAHVGSLLFLTWTALGGCTDPRDGGIEAELEAFEHELNQSAWEACGIAEPEGDEFHFDAPIPVSACKGRLAWTLASCERQALINHPDGARAHIEMRKQVQWNVIRCCSAGGPDKVQPPRIENLGSCTAALVDACMKYENDLGRVHPQGASWGLEGLFKEDNLIAEEAAACFEENGWTSKSGMLPRSCGKPLVCPPERVVLQCYDDGGCDKPFD